MIATIATAAAALVVSASATPILAAVCRRLGVMDHPGRLKIHTRPIPRLGGVALAIAIAAGVFVAQPLAFGRVLVLAAFILVWLTGLLDDIRSLPAMARLISQLIAALLVWRAGFGLLTSPVGGLNLLATIAIVVLFANSFNWLDGSDGLAAGSTAISAFVFFCAFHGDGATAALAVSVAAACVGFLVWNFPPARIFMGDSGSMLLGFAIAFFILDFYRSNSFSLRVALFPALITAVPLLDAALSIARRLRHGRSPLNGDRSHMYDVLLARGWSARKVAILFFGLTTAFASLGWLSFSTDRIAFLILSAVAIAIVLVAAIRMGTLHAPEDLARGATATPQLIASRFARWPGAVPRSRGYNDDEADR